MTRPSSPFALPPTPPLPQLLRQPAAFYLALRALPPRFWRYGWLALLGGLVSGVSGTLLSRSLVTAQSTLSGAPALPPALNFGTGVLSGVFTTLLTWLLLSWLGELGARPRGSAGLEAPAARSSEVYGATQVLPLLWSGVTLLLALLFAPTLEALGTPRLPTGLSGAERTLAVAREALALSREYTASPVVRLVTWGGYAALALQFALAYRGLRAMTGDRSRAQRGVLVPVVVVLVLALASWLAGLGLAQLAASPAK